MCTQKLLPSNARCLEQALLDLTWRLVRAGAAAGDVIPEAELRALLRLVDLEYLTERTGGLRAVVDWGAQLSLGARPYP